MIGYRLQEEEDQVILKWYKNHPENYYLKITIFLSGIGSGIDLKIQLRWLV